MTEDETRLSDDSRVAVLEHKVAALHTAVQNLTEVVKAEFARMHDQYARAVEVLPVARRIERILKDHLHHEAAGGRLAEQHLEHL